MEPRENPGQGRIETRRGLHATVWVLGFVSLFMDVSSEMVHSLLPVFVVTVLHANVLSLGVIEGVSEAAALVSRAFSGALSDLMGRRKPLAVAGYALSAVTKPLFALAWGVHVVFAARFVDRIGKGVRGAPRDALLAEVTQPASRGAAFGLRQSLDTVGAIVGPASASVLMLALSNDIRGVFWIATAPAVLAVALLALGVRERNPGRREHEPVALRVSTLRRLPGTFWVVTALGAVFTLARFSEAFLLLRAEDMGVGRSLIPLVLVLMNVVYAVSAYPAGVISDTVGRIGMVVVGGLLLAAADVALAFAQSPGILLCGVALWGLHMGLTQGVFSTLVAETCPTDLRGSAFGVFGLACGIAVLGASTLAGWLWDFRGPSAAFLAGACIVVFALVGFSAFGGYARKGRMP
ncbi:MAG TPA: MFS transporter [Deltaproteobacteria bacterium]|nr:MFS transporter [Deltaproteobacteria bacterium]HPP79690.1 MFS transporter [Deltaproteobacteria bacterium]